MLSFGNYMSWKLLIGCLVVPSCYLIVTLDQLIFLVLTSLIVDNLTLFLKSMTTLLLYLGTFVTGKKITHGQAYFRKSPNG